MNTLYLLFDYQVKSILLEGACPVTEELASLYIHMII